MTEFAENDSVEWEAGETVYCGAVREVLAEADRHDYLVQVYDRDAEDFASATVRHHAGDVFAAGDLRDDCACEMGDCTASESDETQDTTATEDDDETAADDADAADEEAEADETYYCVGNDGGCSREVDEEGGRCWQHADDE